MAASAVVAMSVVSLPVAAEAQSAHTGVSTAVPVATADATGGGLSDAFGGPVRALVQSLCPIATSVSNATYSIPGVGTLTDQLSGVICAINVAGYVYRTTYLPPSGPPIVKYTKALAGVPTLIDVDGVGLPDFTGTLGVNLLAPGITLTIARSPLFLATNRVTVEAVAINPTTPDNYIGFGEDGSQAGTAKNWKALLSVAGLNSTTADLGLSISVNSPPSSLAVLGEMFSGVNPDAPDHVYRGTAGFSPVPASVNTRIRAAQNRQEVIVSTTPTKLTAKVSILSPGREQNADLIADQLPSTIDIIHSTAGSTDTTTYDATAPIAKVDAAYHDTVNGNIATAAALDAWGIPEHIKFEQTGAKTFIGATSGKIDRIQGRFAQGSDVDPLTADPAPFAKFHRTTADKFTAALQLSNLKSVTINQSAPYGGELVFDTAPGLFPFEAQDDVTSTHLDGSLSNLPADTTVTVDLDNGVVTFDGHGTGIDKIQLHATRPVPFFTRVTRLDATLEGLPALETINVHQENGSVTADASAALGTITLLASDGSGAPAHSGSFASYEDTPSLYRAFLQLDGLKGVSFQGEPLVASLKTAQAQVLGLHGQTSGLTFDGSIDKLPAFLTFSMDGTNGSRVIDYDSHGEAIDKITASVDGLPVPAGMPKIEAEVDHLPSHLTVTVPQTGNVVFDSHGDHIGRVYVQAYAPGHKRSVDPAQQLLAYNDGNHIVANLLQIGSAKVSQSADPLHLEYDIAPQPLDYEAKTSGIDLHGTIANPQPAAIDLATFDKDTDGEGGVTVGYHVDQNNPDTTGDGSIDSISLAGVTGSGYVDATVQHIPANLDICLQTDTGKLCKPSWVPATATDDDRTVLDPDFAMHFFPSDFSGNVPSTPLKVDGVACTDVTDAGVCHDLSQNKVRIVIDDLEFKTAEAAFSSHDEGCDVACGAVWAGASTYGPGSPSEGDHITGHVRYFDGDGDIFPDPKINLKLPAPGGFIALNKLFFFVHYDVISLDPLDVAHSGSLTCGSSPDPELIIGINNLPDPDLLSGIFGVC